MKKAIKFISFAIITVFVIGVISEFLCIGNKKDVLRVGGFFSEPKNTIDVIGIGASELHTSINSPQMWKEYGITSFMLSFGGVPGVMYQPMLEQALKYQNPKLVIIEFNGFLQDDEYLRNPSRMHSFYDNVPLSISKVSSILKTVPRKKWTEYLMPLEKFHNNWRYPENCLDSIEVMKKLRKSEVCYTKPFSTTTETREKQKDKKFTPTFTKLSKKYFIQLLEYCKKKNLKNVMFFRTPHCFINANPAVLTEVQKLVESYGFDYQNFESSFKIMNLDEKKDFYNPDHPNIVGMEKCTSFFGKYITEHYDVKTEHTQEDIERWNTCYEKTKKVVDLAKLDLKNKVSKTYYEISAY